MKSDSKHIIHYELLWKLFNQHFPGFLTVAETRAPRKQLKPKRELDSQCWNSKQKRYERIRLILYIDEVGPCLLTCEVAVSVLPQPELSFSQGLRWSGNIANLAKELPEFKPFYYSHGFSLGGISQLTSQLEGLFVFLSKFTFEKLEAIWNELLHSNPNTTKCIQALDCIRSRYPQMFENPQLVTLEDIESCFKDQGLALKTTTEEMERTFRENKEKRCSNAPFSERLKITYEELNNAGLMQYGFIRFRNAVLDSFGKSNNPLQISHLFDDILTHLSKSGNFASYEDELDELSENLSEEEVKNLYFLLRDKSMRSESEWKKEFFRHFTRFENAFSRERL